MASNDTVVIKAEWFSSIPEQAARDAAAVKAMAADMREGFASTVSAVQDLGKHIDTVGQRSEQVASGGATKLKKAYDDLYESGGRLRESVAGVGESIKYHLQYPMQQLGWVMEGAAAGMVTFGLATASSLQQANLALTSFTGSASLAAGAVQQLRQLQGAVPLAGLESAYETLGQAGMGSGQIMSTLKGLTGISDVSLNPASSMASMASAIASMTSTGLLTTSDVNAFSTAGVDVWGMLAKETGQTPAELRMRFLRAGTPMAVPGGFLSDLASSGAATGGQAAYSKTWAGQMEETKKAAGDLLGVLETPLGNALASAGSKIDSWAQGTEARFKQMGGNIGAEWSSGNMGGLGNTLAQIVGDPKLAGDITTVATGLHGLSNIVDKSVIPMAKDVLHIAAPAFHEFADALDFLGQHQALTETLIGTLGGFVVFSKVARWGEDAAKAIKAFQAVLEGRGLLSAMAAFDRGLLGMSAAEAAAAEGAAADAEGASIAGGGGPGGLSGGSASSRLLGALGGAAGAAMFGTGLFGDLSKGSKASNLSVLGNSVGTGASLGMMFGPEGALIGAGAGAAFGGAYDVARGPVGRAVAGAASDVGGWVSGLFGGGHHTHNTTIRQVNITVPGSGNPNKVANSIPKAFNAQIVAQQARAVRRGQN